MVILLTIVHVVICLFLVIVVLLQSGKAADLAGAIGGMGSQTAFGPRGSATVLSKATTIAAALFMVTSLTLSIIATRTGATGAGTVLETQPAPAGEVAPAPAPTVDPGNGQEVPIPVPEPPAQQQSAPAPAQQQ